MSEQWKQEMRDRLPAPGDTPLEHLRHTVAAFGSNTPDDSRVVTATRGPYPDREWTGLTWGDLRSLLVRLESAELTTYPWCWEHSCESDLCSPRHE